MKLGKRPLKHEDLGRTSIRRRPSSSDLKGVETAGFSFLYGAKWQHIAPGYFGLSETQRPILRQGLVPQPEPLDP